MYICTLFVYRATNTQQWRLLTAGAGEKSSNWTIKRIPDINIRFKTYYTLEKRFQTKAIFV